MENDFPELEERLRFVVGWVFVLLVLTLGLGAFVFWFLADWNSAYLVKKIDSDFHVIIGLPAAAAAALMIVIFLRTTEGPIEFELLGLKFKGAFWSDNSLGYGVSRDSPRH